MLIITKKTFIATISVWYSKYSNVTVRKFTKFHQSMKRLKTR